MISSSAAKKPEDDQRDRPNTPILQRYSDDHLRALGRLLKQRTDLGLWHWLGDLLLEPRNPFQKSRRKPKRSLSIVAVLAALGLSIVFYFHVL